MSEKIPVAPAFSPVLWHVAALAGAAILLMAVVAGLAGWPWLSEFLTPRPAGVVVITLDTTRADRLSPYGLMDVSMPHLERLAREGIVFDQASSVAPLTLPAHCSLFTGLFPPRHHVRDNADRPLASDHTTLAEILQGQGFKTAAFVGSVVLDPERGLKQGFDQYGGVSQATLKGRATSMAADTRQRRADEVIDDATRWLGTINGSRFFLWTHLYDPHRPYDPPEPFRSRYIDPYVGEIAFADAQIGRLLEALDRRQLLDRTIVVVAGDHGESLGEHGERDHGIFLYESVLRVPLIIRAPTLSPRRVGAAVRLVDVMPTVLGLLDLPEPSVDGVSLVDLMNGSRRHLDLDVFAESMYPERFGWSSLRALRDGRFKLIDAPRPELYDLERDPFEERNLYEEAGRHALADALTRRVKALAGGSAPDAAEAVETAAVPPGLREGLAALGYMAATPVPASKDGTGRPDPKDCIGLIQADLRSADRAIGSASISDRVQMRSGDPCAISHGSLDLPIRDRRSTVTRSPDRPIADRQ